MKTATILSIIMLLPLLPICDFSTWHLSRAGTGAVSARAANGSASEAKPVEPSGMVYMQRKSDDNASALALDDEGNVYVTGSSIGIDTDFDYITIKHSADGSILWAVRYNGPGDSVDKSEAIVLGVDGGIYVTGRSKGTNGDFDYATVKYNSDGEELWVRRYNGSGESTDEAVAIAAAPSGGVYVTGKSKGEEKNYDFATIKYDTNGMEIWVARYNSSGKSYDEATGIATDGSGNIYVIGRTGRRVGPSVDFDYRTIKYGSDGEEQWVANYDYEGNFGEKPTALVTDDRNGVIVTGFSIDDATMEDYATVRYSSDGWETWTARYNSRKDNVDWAQAIGTDGDGNAYVTGWGGSHPDYDFVTVKYDRTGKKKWSARYDGEGNSLDWAASIAVHSSGAVYVSGKSKGSDHSYDFVTVKYGLEGKQEWVRRYNGPSKSDDRAIANVVDDSGRVLVTGSSRGEEGDYDIVTIKYGVDGVVLWIAIFDSASK